MAKKSFFKQDKEEDSRGALFIPAGILTGIGVGFLVNNVPAGTMIGLGLGFTVFAVISVVKNNHRHSINRIEE